MMETGAVWTRPQMRLMKVETEAEIEIEMKEMISAYHHLKINLIILIMLIQRIYMPILIVTVIIVKVIECFEKRNER